MDFDAFDQGIELGGLRNRDDIRLLICYLLKTVDKPVEKSQLNDSLLANGIANYFEINQAVEELISNGSIAVQTVDGEDCYTALGRGREIADSLSSDLPRTVRENAVNSLIESMTLKASERENEVDIQPTADGGYVVTLKLKSMGAELMKLELYTVDLSQAQLLKKNFLKDPVKLYSSIIAGLTV
jgi:hypothetical protein